MGNCAGHISLHGYYGGNFIMMRSLFSAVSGLKAHQTKMDVIGNNIANVNTVAYKSQSVTFGDVYYQTTQVATGPNEASGKGGTNAKQIGLGSTVGAISVDPTAQGASERTDNTWDLMISGDKFFVVSNAGNTYFTRAGDFTTDLDGAIVTQSGANVMGWKADADGNIIKDRVQALYATSPEYTYTAPAATTGVTITGNVDSRETGDIAYTVNFYDSLGNEYQATLNLTYDSKDAAAGTTSYNVVGGSVTMNGQPTELSVSCDSQVVFNTNTGASMVGNAGLALTFTDNSADGSGNIANIGTNNGNTSTINLDASGLTMYAAASNINATMGINGTGAGKAVGKMKSVGVNEAGQIVASYSNGDTKKIGQIAVASFTNPSGLEKVGDNLYAATLNSGSFDGIGEDISESSGKITSGYLEMSNVDLADQFTNMITTQRGYQANSRIITVSDTMLEELINLKR